MTKHSKSIRRRPGFSREEDRGVVHFMYKDPSIFGWGGNVTTIACKGYVPDNHCGVDNRGVLEGFALGHHWTDVTCEKCIKTSAYKKSKSKCEPLSF